MTYTWHLYSDTVGYSTLQTIHPCKDSPEVKSFLKCKDNRSPKNSVIAVYDSFFPVHYPPKLGTKRLVTSFSSSIGPNQLHQRASFRKEGIQTCSNGKRHVMRVATRVRKSHYSGYLVPTQSGCASNSSAVSSILQCSFLPAARPIHELKQVQLRCIERKIELIKADVIQQCRSNPCEIPGNSSWLWLVNRGCGSGSHIKPIMNQVSTDPLAEWVFSTKPGTWRCLSVMKHARLRTLRGWVCLLRGTGNPLGVLSNTFRCKATVADVVVRALVAHLAGDFRNSQSFMHFC